MRTTGAGAIVLMDRWLWYGFSADYLYRRLHIYDCPTQAFHPSHWYGGDFPWRSQRVAYFGFCTPHNRARPNDHASKPTRFVRTPEAGLGLAMLPCFMADHRPHLVAVLPDEMVVNRTFYASMHEDTRNVTRVKVVWDWLKEIVATNETTLLGQVTS